MLFFDKKLFCSQKFCYYFNITIFVVIFVTFFMLLFLYLFLCSKIFIVIFYIKHFPHNLL